MGNAPGRRPQWLVHPRTGTWRWWSGHHWTQYTVVDPRRPSLPPFLSVPVVVFLVLDVVVFLGTYLQDALLLVIAAAPSLLVLAFLLFLDRVEPEPADGRWHALLWGMFVAGFLAGVVNEAVEFAFGPLAALLLAAPIGEEALKGAGILWAVKRGEIDDALDGAIYAGWVAVGFTVAEDFAYYVMAANDGTLIEMIAVRSVGTFAHPLFTVWIGIAVGRAVHARTDVRRAAIRGSGAAIGLHFLWNFTTLFDLWFAAFLAFVVLAGFAVHYLRRHERDFRHDVNGAAQLIAKASASSPLSPTALRTLETATDPLQVRAMRSRLSRRARRALDAERTAIVRLMLRVRRAGIVYPAEILEISDHLAEIERLAGATGPPPPNSAPIQPPSAPPPAQGTPRGTRPGTPPGTPGWDPWDPGPNRPSSDVDPFG